MQKFDLALLLDKYRVMPRTVVGGYAALIWVMSQWFMELPDPNGAQSTFVSVLVGASAAVFGFYVNSGCHNAK